MGRSFLSVKLALAFGLCVSVLVLLADGAQAGGVGNTPAAVEQSATAPAPAAAQGKAAGADVCLWRGCPLTWAPSQAGEGQLGRAGQGAAGAGRLTYAGRRGERAT